MNNRLIATNFSFPCPICSKTNGNCRLSARELILCMTNVSSYKDEFKNLGWKYIGDTSDGVWGMFLPYTGDYDEAQKEAYRNYQLAQSWAREERFKGSLSISERDKNIRAISNSLGLSAQHKQDLLDRGLTEKQIKEGFYFTIEPFDKVPSSVSPRLAGTFVGRGGHLVIGSEFSSGIACPSFTRDGLISGFQIRRESKENKYIWASTSAKGNRQKISSHLPNGELPLTYHGEGRKRLYMLEGLMKPDMAHHIHNIDTIGAAGGNYYSCKKQLEEIVSNYEEIVLIPDAGDVLNRQVLNRIKRNYELCKSLGHELKIGWYGQIKKEESGDIDEIEELDYLMLSYEEFVELAHKIQYEVKKRGNLKEFTEFTHNILINTRYVSEALNNLDYQGKILAINSAKNTGKSFWLKKHCQKLFEAGKKIILIGNRRILTTELCNELNITFINLNDDEDDALYVFEQFRSAGLVVDSALKLRNLDWTNAVLIIDEAEQFLSSLLLSKTHIESVRGKVLALFSQCFPQLSSIILLDSDLADLTCSYFSQVAKKEVLKLKNEYVENKRDLFVLSEREQAIAYIDKQIESGFENIFIMSDSKANLTALHHNYKDQYESILLTQESLADNPTLWEYIKNDGAKIQKDKIRLVFGSPVIQSGLNFKLYKELNGIKNSGYFDTVMGLFYGVVSPNIARQMLIRDRSDSKRICWIAERGVFYQNEFDFSEIKKQEEFRKDTIIDLVNYKSYLNPDDSLEEIWGKVGKLIKGNEIYDLNQEFRAKLIAKRNIQLSDYKQILLEELFDEGYRIFDETRIIDGLDIERASNIEEIKEHLREEEAERQFKAEEIDEVTAKSYEKKDSLKQKERAELAKYHLMQMLPNFPLSIEFIALYSLKNHKKIIKSIQRLVLCENVETAKALDIKQINYQLEMANDSGFLWLSDVKDNSIAVEIYQKLGLKELFASPENVIDKEFMAKFEVECRKIRALLRIFNIKWSFKSPKLILLKKVLNLFGYKTTLLNRTKKERTYQIEKLGLMDKKEDSDNIWQLIYSSLKTRFSEVIEINNPLENHFFENHCQSYAYQKLEVVTQPPNHYEPDSHSVTNSNLSTDIDTNHFFQKSPEMEIQAEIVPKETINSPTEKEDNQSIENSSEFENLTDKIVSYQDEFFYCRGDYQEMLSLIKDYRNEDDDIIVERDEVKVIKEKSKVFFWNNQGDYGEGVVTRLLGGALEVISQGIKYICGIHQLNSICFSG